MATTISSGTNPYKLGSPPDFGTLYSGRALEFDGVADYVDMGSGVFSEQIKDYPFTVSGYSNISAASGDDFIWTINDESTTDVKYGLKIRRASGEGELRLHAQNTTAQTATTSGADEFNNGNWHFWAVVFESSTSMKLYANGELRATQTSTVTYNTACDSFTLGADGESSGLTSHLAGKLSNIQIWNVAWSLSDVQYAYTHPEKLITDNSAVTSGTTISNLKAWYPCTEGNPRSPQTTVYDGSPKGALSGELVANGTFDTDISGWEAEAGGSTVAWNSGQMDIVRSGSTSAGVQTAGYDITGLTVGYIYRLTAHVTARSHGVSIAFSGSATTLEGGATLSATGVVWRHVVASSTAHTLYIGARDSASATATIDNVSVKQIGVGNHGTTTFYGVMSDLLSSAQKTALADSLDADNDTFDFATGTTSLLTGDATGFTDTVSCTFANISGAGRITNDSAAAGRATMPITTVVGRTYQVQFDCIGVSGGQLNVSLGATTAYNSGNKALTAGAATGLVLNNAYTATATTMYLVLTMTSASDTHWVSIDNLKVWEVGVATGWTTADAEPLIPQTALMGMSKPMLFSQTNDVYLTNTSLNLSHAQLSWSMWLFGSEAGGAEHLFATSTGGGGDLTNVFMNFSSDYVFRYGSASLSVTSGDAGTHQFTAGKWIHAVFIADSTNNLVQVYQNGALTLSSSQTFDTPVYGNGISVGARGGSGSPVNAYEDQMNEFSVWNTALTLAEVQELFNDGVALDATTHSKVANLKGYWRNDGATSWEDRSATSNTLTLTGSPDTILLPEGTTSGKDILGFPLTHTNNGWLNLDGNEYVDAGDNSVFAIVHDLSIECWFKTAVTGLSYGLVGKGGAAGNTGYFLFKLSNEKVRFVVDQSDGTATTADSGSTLSDGDWHHVVGVYNSGTNIQLYIDNGSPVTVTTDIESKALDDAGSFIIGDTQDGIYQFDGSIDEARLYNRALSAAEVTKNYKHGKAKHS